MKNFILFDDPVIREDLLPFTFTRPVAEIRMGILTIREKWEKLLGAKVSYFTVDYLQSKFKLGVRDGQENIWVNGAVLPCEDLVKQVKMLKPGQGINFEGKLLAVNAKVSGNSIPVVESVVDVQCAPLLIDKPWKIFQFNGDALKDDFVLLTKGRKSVDISSENRLISPENIYVEEGARVLCSVINASSGPVYIGKDAEVMEGCMIRGPFALCEHATVKMGAKIYGPTTIGPHSKVGGEINNSVIFGYSNKAHDGFLGNSVIGEWCNIGADSNNSNLKNNYAEVKLWSYRDERFVNTGLQFCGLMMGDHSKCGINTMFNTGTVVGVNANVFGAGFPRNFIPDFSWGGASGFVAYKTAEAIDVAEKVMGRRKIFLTKEDKDILQKIFENTEKYRK